MHREELQTLERKRAEYREAIKQHYDIDDDTRTLQEQETLRQVLGTYEAALGRAPCPEFDISPFFLLQSTYQGRHQR